MNAGQAEQNPARDVKMINTRPQGHYTWTIDKVFQFEDRHPVGSKARLAMALMLYTGACAFDATRLGPQMELDGRLHFPEYKNRKSNPKQRIIPILPQLNEIIEATPSGHLSYLVTKHNKPYSTAKPFSNWFKRQCEMAVYRIAAHTDFARQVQPSLPSMVSQRTHLWRSLVGRR